MSKQLDKVWREARRRAIRLLESRTDEEDAEIKRGIAADPDARKLTDEDFAKMRPAAEVHPDLVAFSRRRRGLQKSPTKQLISLRLDRDIIEHFRKRGPGWQGKINETLRKAARLRKKA